MKAAVYHNFGGPEVLEDRLPGRGVDPLRAVAAADEDLAPGHWFWDEAISGGIFGAGSVFFGGSCGGVTGGSALFEGTPKHHRFVEIHVPDSKTAFALVCKRYCPL